MSQKEYKYSSLQYSRSFQLQAELEGTLAFQSPLPEIIQTAYADTQTTTSYLKGNYNGLVARTQTGTTIYLIATPSILTSTGQSGQSLDITTLSGTLLYNNQSTTT